jgi:outer membrane lipoprotein LolB
MRSLYGIFSTLLFATVLTACTTVAPPSAPTQETWQTRKAQLESIQNWQLNGKVAVQTAQDSGSATLDWQENHGSYSVSLYGPLGAGALKINGHPGNATLTLQDGKKFTANSPETLLAKNWGFNLPVSYLRYWVRGLPVPGLTANMQFDSYHRVTSLSQQGWQVQIQSYTRAGGAELPSRLAISSASLRGKLVIHEWIVN